MACGAPVLAFSGGAVEEVVSPGLSGFICKDVEEMAAKAREVRAIDHDAIRAYMEQNFSVERMAADYAELFREVAGSRELIAPAVTENEFAGENSIAA
jgi:glycosyltransferase involved in cell wall biosynthesis